MPSSTSPELIIGGEDEVKELPFGIESEDSSRYTDDPYGDAEVLGPHDDMRRLPASLRSIPPRIYTSTLIGIHACIRVVAEVDFLPIIHLITLEVIAR